MIKCEQKQSEQSQFGFKIELRAKINDKKSVQVFLQEFYESSHVDFNIKHGCEDKANTSEKVVYRGRRKCSMNVFRCGKENKEKQPGKDCGCASFIKFRLDKCGPKTKYHETHPEKNQERIEKIDYPLHLEIDFCHNHAINRAEFLKFRTVSDSTKRKYTQLFESGFSPSGAHSEVKREMKSQSSDWPKLFADRSIVPSIFWVYYWHRNWLESRLGSKDGITVFEKAEEMVRNYNQKCKADYPDEKVDYYAKISQTPQGETVVTVVNPFMRRVHRTIPQSGDIVMCDATSNLDRTEIKLIHMIIPSVIGGLPVAEILITREDAPTLTFAFQQLCSMLDESAFYGRGSNGPILFMTDDSACLRKALSINWVIALILLCQFHVLQAVWNWLWAAKNGILKSDRPVLLRLFREIVYARTHDSKMEKIKLLEKNKTYKKYPQFSSYLNNGLMPRIDFWSTEFRVANRCPTNRNNTNNLVETSFRYTKDIQLNRLKAYNFTDLLSLILDDSEFYQTKAVDAANNRIETWLKSTNSKYIFDASVIDETKIQQLVKQLLW